MNKNKNNGKILIIAIILIAVLFFVFRNSFNLGSIVPIQGGTILGVSYLQFFSNNNQLNSPAYLVNLVVNNGGESLNGSINSYSTSASSLTQNINNHAGTSYSNTNPNQQITINTNLNSLNLSIPYYYSGYYLYTYNYSVKSLSYQLPNAYYGTCNSHEFSNNTVELACAGSTSSTVLSELAGFTNTLSTYCNNQYTNGVLLITNSSSASLSLLGTINLASAYGYNYQCVQPYLSTLGEVLDAGTSNYNYNVSIIFSNQTFTHTLYLSTQSPQNNYNNILYAQVYGLESTGQGLSETPAPSLIFYTNTNLEKRVFVNYLTTSTGLGEAYSQQQLNNTPVPVSNLLLTPYQISSGTQSNAYLATSFYSAINNNNRLILNDLTPIQPTNPYYSLSYPIYSGGASFVSQMNLLSNPPVYPEVQLIAKLSTLGVYIPVINPTITSVSPPNIVVRSGSSTNVNFNVYNNASVSGNGYITGYCGSNTFQTSNFNIPANGQVSVTATINPPSNPNNANTNVNCQATISSAYNINSKVFNFGITVQPICPSGTIYENNTNCVSEYPSKGNSSCITGYYMANNGSCEIIPPKCFSNQTSNYSTFPPHCNNSTSNNNNIGIGWYVLIIVIVIIIGFILVLKKNNNGRRRYRYGR